MSSKENFVKINLVKTTSSKIETSPPVSVTLVSPQTPLAEKDNRQIKSSDYGNYSITFANRPCNKQSSIETNGELLTIKDFPRVSACVKFVVSFMVSN